MPSEMVDQKGLPSSSFLSEETHLPNAKQVGFWKAEMQPDSYGASSVASSTMEKQNSMESQAVKNFMFSGDSYTVVCNKNDNGGLEKCAAVGAERATSRSLGRALGHHDPGKRSTLNADHTSYCKGADGVDIMGAQSENGLFSSSFSELFSRKMRLTSNHALFGHSVGADASHYEEEESIESLKEMEAQTIGNLLPSDDDLLSGVTDGLDCLGGQQPNMKEDIDDLDLFSSVGGLDLGEDDFSGQLQDFENQPGGSINPFAGEHPYGERPSRTLFVRNINSNVEDSELQTLFELYGDVRTLYTACKHRGFVMISYYDLRAARNAMRALQNKPLRRRKLDVHFSIPKDNPSDQDINQSTLVVFNLNSSVSNEELCQIFGAFGDIKEIRDAVHSSHHKCIEYYDIRAAEAALHALNRSEIAGKQIRIEPGCPAGAQWSRTASFPLEPEQVESGLNLQQIHSPGNSALGFYGPVFGMSNGSITATQGPPSSGPFMENMFHHHGGISSSNSVPNNFPSLMRVESLGNPSSIPGGHHHHSNSQSQGGQQLKLGLQVVAATPHFHPHSLPDYSNDGLAHGCAPCNSQGMPANVGTRPCERIIENHQFRSGGLNGQHPHERTDTVFGLSGNGSCPMPAHHYMWRINSQRPQPPQGMMWPSSPTFVNEGIRAAAAAAALPPPRMSALPGAASHMLNPLLPVSNHNVGSAPSVIPSLWDRRHAYAGESPDASGFHPGSLGSMRLSGNSPHHLEFLSPNMFPCGVGGGNFMDTPTIPSKNMAAALHQRCMMLPGRGGQMIPMMSSSPFGSPNERGTRSRRNEGNSNTQGDNNKKQFELDLDNIMRGDDKRTTLMIKNIPNKYTSKMLLAAIDERHRGTYDFIYLPIDFKNKCNVGYAFINMIDPTMIIPFYQAFNGKKWEKFNSEKVASLAYARIQGKAALIAHFQNSSLMNEDKRCRPILFNTDGPNAGDQVPFPMGVNVRSRPSKTRASTSEENYLENVKVMSNVGEEAANEDYTSTKDID